MGRYKKYMLIFCCGLIIIGVWLSSLYVVTIDNMPEPDTTKPAVILVCMSIGGSGEERCTLEQQKQFIAAGIPTILVCRNKSFLARECSKNNLPFVACSPFRLSLESVVFMPGLTTALKKIIRTYKNILAIHCSCSQQIIIARQLTTKTTILVVLTQHSQDYRKTYVSRYADGVIAVSKNIALHYAQSNAQDHISTPIIAIAPLFDATRIRSFTQIEQTREVFFKQHFNITLQPCPLLIKVASFYEMKNHPLLFQAMHELIYKQGIPVQVALAGSGPLLDLYKKMVRDLNLDLYVHFLGNTDKMASLMHYAEINILTSTREAFGIVLLEGGLMKKPTIVARDGCDAADWLIIDQETGFLFKNKNAHDLANTIAFVLEHPKQAKACGHRLYEKVINEFMPDQTAQKILDFYEALQAQLKTEKELQ